MKYLKRKQIRLKRYDYSRSGYYFVTICTQNRVCLFGDIINVGVGRDRSAMVVCDRSVGVWRDKPIRVGCAKPEMALNQLGKIVDFIWQSLPQHHLIELDQFQIMPNHVHMIIQIQTDGLRSMDASRRAPTLGTIIGLFKSEITKQIRITTNNPKFLVCQRNFYEHIIHNKSELDRIREYIKTNPAMWDRDRNNPEFRN